MTNRSYAGEVKDEDASASVNGDNVARGTTTTGDLEKLRLPWLPLFQGEDGVQSPETAKLVGANANILNEDTLRVNRF